MITFLQAQQSSAGYWLKPLTQPSNTPLQGGAFDTRQLGDAQIFFALKGEQNDGHHHLPKLQGSAVDLAVISHPAADLGGYTGAVLVVKDVQQALARMAQWLVEHYKPKVVAITGSYGKTTSKEIIAHVLSQHWRVLNSEGSYNNELGIPLTLLNLSAQIEVVVLEYSARNPGDIAYLCRIAPPDVGVLTAVGSAHIGVFGSQQAILKTKGELFANLAPGGVAIYNGLDKRLAQLAKPHPHLAFYAPAPSHANTPKTTSHTLNHGKPRPDPNGFYAQNSQLNAQGMVAFEGVHQHTRQAMQANVVGVHGAQPVLAAWAVATALGAPDAAQLAQAASHAKPLYGRAQPSRTSKGAFMLDDTYNASPETVANLLHTLDTRPEANKVLVLGPLSELEPNWQHTSQQIAQAFSPHLSAFILYEPQPKGLSQALTPLLPANTLQVVTDWHDLLNTLQPWNTPNSAIGIKGARSAHMERLVLTLQGQQEVRCQRQPCPLLTRCNTCTYLHSQHFSRKMHPLT